MAPQPFQLVMRSGPTPGKVFPLESSDLTIGRDTTNDIVINDAEVSRKHARLFLQGGGFVLEDLGSTNGTFVNGQRLMGPHGLRPGELIMLGENIGLAFEASQFDPNATVVASAPPLRETPAVTFREELPEALKPVAPPPAFAEPPAYSPQPAYAGQVPPGPVEEFETPADYAAPKKSNTRTWILAGCGCLLLLLCFLAVGGYIFDSLNLYCQVPGINSFFNCP
jgi:pSer/pThr/pTyr-binding forkhead associated (FHA) protein